MSIITLNAATLDGVVKPAIADFEYAVLSNAGNASGICTGVEYVKGIGAGNLNAGQEAWVREKLPFAYILLLRMTRALDNTVDANGANALSASMLHQNTNIGQFLDMDFRINVFAQSPQVAGLSVNSVNAPDFEKKEWQDFLWAKRDVMANGLTQITGFVVNDLANGRQVLNAIVERSHGRISAPENMKEAVKHVVVARCNTQGLEDMCQSVQNPSLIMTAERLKFAGHVAAKGKAS